MFKTVNDSGRHEHFSDANVTEVCIPLCCKWAAGLGSESWREASVQVQVEVVEVLILQRAMFPKMKEVLHQEEEQGRALFGKKQYYFLVTCRIFFNSELRMVVIRKYYTQIYIQMPTTQKVN